jgi:beta-glucosidase
MTTPRSLVIAVLCALALSACNRQPTATAAASIAPPPKAVEWPRVNSPVLRDERAEARIAELLSQLTLEQKVAQMVQPDIRWVTPADVRKYKVGSILNGGGAWPANKKSAAIADWVRLADQYYDASMDKSGGAPAIPVIWGVDAVHGHNNVVGATLFPHNIGLGAAHDPDLLERIGEITAREVAVTGLDWVFAPTVAVVRDDRWGRTYEGYSEDPEIVRDYAARIVRGLQGVPGTPAFLDAKHVTATAKHFLGDGGTRWGIDHGDTCATEQDLLNLHAQGYIGALAGGVQTVMASYNSWQGTKLHGHRYLLTDVLKGKLGFDGLVVSDWDGIDEVQGCAKDRCAQAVNAGIDLFMVPTEWKSFINNTVAQVRAGDIPESRIDDAVTRILRVKLRAGLFEHGRPSSRPAANHRELLGAAEHRAVAREAVRKSLVLLKNTNQVLPLAAKANVLVTGDGADNMAKQAGGWTITWQGTETTPADFPGGTTIFEGIRANVTSAGGTATLSKDGNFKTKPDVAIVVFGENPYAEWFGNIPVLDRAAKYRNGGAPAPEASALGATCDRRDAHNDASSQTADGGAGAASALSAAEMGKSLSEAPQSSDLALLQNLKKQGIPVVAVFLTGRPLYIAPELDASDAFVVAWLPGSEGAGLADVLFRKPDGSVRYNFSGKLSYSWPRTPQDTNVNRGDASYSPLFPYGFGLTYEGSGAQSPTALAMTR